MNEQPEPGGEVENVQKYCMNLAIDKIMKVKGDYTVCIGFSYQ